MPTPNAGLGVVVVNDVLYAMGGYVTGNSLLTTVEAYDAEKNT